MSFIGKFLSALFRDKSAIPAANDNDVPHGRKACDVGGGYDAAAPHSEASTSMRRMRGCPRTMG